MTGIDDEDKEVLHWQAVPSWREIWQKRKASMTELVPPSNGFLIQGLTLNVKKEAVKPGARLVVKGMRGLVNVTLGLQENFQLVLKGIVERHSGAVQRIDDYLRHCRAVTPHSRMELSTSFAPSDDKTTKDIVAFGELFLDSSLSRADGYRKS